MSDEFEQKLEAKSDYAGDATSVSTPDIDAVPDAELPDQELYHSHSWWTTYCLLYTSPSPRDISGSRMPSSA